MPSAASAQTTWLVTGTGDASGTTVCTTPSSCSTLRSAIYAADKDTGDTIDVAVTGTIDLTGPLPQITSNMTINGPGASELTISGQGQYQIFNAPNVTTLAVSGLTLADGNAGSSSGGGGAIYAVTLAVTNCTFIGNSAPAQTYAGGAIYAVTLAVTNCTFIGNSAPAQTDAGGGAIYAYTLTVTNSTFTDNSAFSGGGAIEDVIPKGTITIANSTFTGNSSDFAGGAIRQNGPLTITNSTFSGNSAPSGGAVYWQGLNFTMTVTNSTFAGNSAVGKGANGGAIYWNGSTNAAMTVTNSIFSGNLAPSDDGGGIYVQNGGPVTESNNLFYGSTGGDIIVAGTPQGLSSTDVTGSNPSLTPLGNYGGPTETMMPEPGSAAICKGDAADDVPNSVTTDQRGFPLLAVNCSNGGVDIGAVQTNYLLVTNTSSSSSTTGSLPYEVSLANGQPYADIGFDLPTTTPATITLTSALSLTQGDTVIIGSPDAVTISGQGQYQIFNAPNVMTLAVSGLTLAGGNAGSGRGGAIYAPSIAVTNCTFIGNSAYSGGAIWAGTLTVANSTFTDNSALGGGAIEELVPKGTTTITNSTFTGNYSSNAGGGAIRQIGPLTITNSTFSGNSADGTGGGAIYWFGLYFTMTVTNSTFSGNSAVGTGSAGGAVYWYNTDSSATMTVTNSIFSGNLAPSGSGGIYTQFGKAPTESNNLFYENYVTGAPTVENDANFTLSSADLTGLDPNLATLGNYGGPTQTMLPLPGSAAICAGSAADVPNSVTTDQRGFPRTTTYTVNSSPLACVDIGAVQTNYQSIQFTNLSQLTNNTYNEVAGSAVTPPVPVVSVTENGQNIGGVPVTLDLSPTPSAAPTGATVPTVAGAGASFDGLTVPLADVGTYTLSSTLNLFTPKGATTPVSITTNPTASLAVSLGASSVTDYVAYLGQIGVLTSGQVNSLTKEWDKAIQLGSEGKYSGAISNLNDFIAEVNDLYSSGVLTQTEATALINAANYQIGLY